MQPKKVEEYTRVSNGREENGFPLNGSVVNCSHFWKLAYINLMLGMVGLLCLLYLQNRLTNRYEVGKYSTPLLLSELVKELI